MTAADEATFIQLWQEGASYQAIAQALGCPLGTVKSRAHTLAHAGKITPRPRGGAYPRQQALARQAREGLPSTVDPAPSTVHPIPSTVDHLREDLQVILTTALQPVLARLDALETGLAQPRPADRSPSTVDPDTVDRPPSTVDPDTWELKPLKHSVRWTIYVPQAMKEALQHHAAAIGQPPSLLVQQALQQWLEEHHP
jgi:DNA-binding transcriptional MocR family regulator